MKITRISTAIVEANFDWVFVKIETDEKITGWGEAFLGPGITAVIKEFAAILIGEDPTSIDRILRRLRGSVIYTSPGLMYHAIGGIECALLDIIGKRYQMPVWQLLGGKYRDQVRIYADCHAGDALESITPLLVPRTPAWMDPTGESSKGAKVSLKHHGWDASRPESLTSESYAARAAEMAARGFRILKFDVDVPTPFETDEYNRDLSPPEVDYAADLAMAVRKAVGPEIGLAIDCHWNYGVAAAVEMARALEPVRLLWLEDPTAARKRPRHRRGSAQHPNPHRHRARTTTSASTSSASSSMPACACSRPTSRRSAFGTARNSPIWPTCTTST